ncbi:DUF5789 family protein [Halobaculum litoreum]|uniref:DUF5789 family protein n=1 Tax=Halobaculum litoreum TaxID=3031998 RepID=A0ABD5XTU3_9EURY|nr:DUF5789 family protein [Halobaculum sp. DT92]
MRLPETRTVFADRLTFPTDRETVVTRVGDVRLEAPNGEDTTVATVLDRASVSTFASADDLHATLVAFVGDAFVGRKFYDDRGDQTAVDTDQQSF